MHHPHRVDVMLFVFRFLASNELDIAAPHQVQMKALINGKWPNQVRLVSGGTTTPIEVTLVFSVFYSVFGRFIPCAKVRFPNSLITSITSLQVNATLQSYSELP